MDLINKKFQSLISDRFGTENMSLILYSLVKFCRPVNLLEIGLGYSTLFLAKSLQDIKYDIQNYSQSFSWKERENFFKFKYNPSLDVIDNFTPENNYINNVDQILKKYNLDKHVNFINTDLWDHLDNTNKNYDFIWVDAGSWGDYYKIMDEVFPKLSKNSQIIFHNTVSQIEGKLFETEMKLYSKENKIQDLEIISFEEPHKNYQNCFTICKKIN